MATYRALVTNDDGIHSLFLHRLVEALLPNFSVCVAAPKKEQSWIGRSYQVAIRTFELKKIRTFSQKKSKPGALQELLVTALI